MFLLLFSDLCISKTGCKTTDMSFTAEVPHAFIRLDVKMRGILYLQGGILNKIIVFTACLHSTLVGVFIFSSKYR